MTEIDSLILRIEQSGREMFWQGRSSSESIDKLEALLGSRLPASFKTFLGKYGGGGFDDADALISGIENDNPELEHRGTVYGDTLRCRSECDLPENLVVIYLSSHDVVWCLDVSRWDGDECPVVAYDVFSRRIKILYAKFDSFIKEYLLLRM
jgi:antitoxin YobK